MPTFPFGKYAGADFSEVPESYLLFWANKASPNNKSGIQLQDQVREYLASSGISKKIEERRQNAKYAGKVNSRVELFVRCDKSEVWNSTRHYVTFLNECVTRDGIKVIYRGSKRWEPGMYYQVEATVSYNKLSDEGAAISWIRRPKVLKVVDKEGNPVT
jgi:uncharacterized protein (DUF3820 family)